MYSVRLLLHGDWKPVIKICFLKEISKRVNQRSGLLPPLQAPSELLAKERRISFEGRHQKSYGDMHPTGWLKALSAIEALTGAVFMALIVAVIARKCMR